MIIALAAILPLAACSSDRGATTAPSSGVSTATASGVSGAHVTANEGSGNTITSLVTGTSCPTLHFMVSTYLIKTDAATIYSGGTCASLRAGTVISMTVRATTEESQTAYASQITILGGGTTPTTPTTPTTSTPVNTDVVVTSLVSTTACPALSFLVGPYTVTTSTATHWEVGACANLKAGSKVALTGTRMGDGPIVATNIAFRDVTTPTTPTEPTRPSEPVDGEGAISSVSTSRFFWGSTSIKSVSAL